ncbi:aminotransferase class III-fold pyridoxal phosphate-dependent enzyme [Natronococcus sp. A-GB7]|uniref:aminotransferase family protein n=1 Tax=Natronococcus sp. A-GB7 TaxID=3037649 RepID=UPI00241F6F33|nr:aminotransferase class III-fold pyridoxal phosphate-dependent enzyme [Natronococcus sp. A-GB7]MDG5820757.1 aminotransferase class III-fold pyridoxal phosphate-dependent enzyme [Natronococcus sp. A-GB7]
MASERPKPVEERSSMPVPHWYTADEEVATLIDGNGVTVSDADGTDYLDFQSQLYCVNAGHSNQQIIDAIAEQLSRIPYVSSGKHNNTRSELAARLLEIAPDPMARTVFSVSGSEANETAVMIAREYTGSPTVLTRWRSYHGATYGVASLTGDTDTRTAIEAHAATTGNAKFLPPIPSAFGGATGEELAERAANHLEFVIRNEGPDSIAALLTEIVAGSSGGFTAPPGYYERVRELCDEYDIILIADEVITGFGRCGEWFGVDTEDINPDMMTFAKGVTSSYVPLAGVMVREEFATHLEDDGFDVGQTFAGHPVGCAAGLAAIDAYEDNLLENARAIEPRLKAGLETIDERFDVVSSVHGRGLLWGVEFADPGTGEPLVDPRVCGADNPVKQVLKHASNQGVLFGLGRPGIQLLVAPPLCVDETEIDKAIAALESSIKAVF